jgi:hypothetical protein
MYIFTVYNVQMYYVKCINVQCTEVICTNVQCTMDKCTIVRQDLRGYIYTRVLTLSGFGYFSTKV